MSNLRIFKCNKRDYIENSTIGVRTQSQNLIRFESITVVLQSIVVKEAYILYHRDDYKIGYE